MSSVEESVRGPLQGLIDDLWQSDRRQAEEQEASLAQLEEAMAALQGWSDRLEEQQAEQEAALNEFEVEQLAHLHHAEEHRKRLDEDLAAARARIAELEGALQTRTEELLAAQASNNALAAELQEIRDTAPLAPPPEPPAHEDGGAPGGGSVSERFKRLREKRCEEFS